MDNVKRFAEQYGGLAATIGQKLGVSPDVLLGQWGLETGWGKSVVPGTNNLGNIKDFSGRGTKAKDNMTGSVDAYRVYATPEAFGDDFAGLLSRRYKDALGSGSDATKFASALKAKGYAEDPDYVSKLSSAAGMVRKFADKALTAVSGTANAGTPNMPKIDASQVKWDDSPAPAKIDAAQVKWDDAPAQPAKRFNKAGDADTNAFSTAAVGAWNEAQKLPYVGPVVRGISDTIIGGAQLLGQAGNKIGVVDDATLANFERNAAGMEKSYTDARAARGGEGFDAGRLTGNIISTLPLGGVAGAGRTVGAKIGAGAAAGAVAGALQPVASDDFWREKGAQAGTGALIGAAFPAIGAGARATGRALGLGQGAVSPEVAQLAQRAKALGIDVRADQLVNSKPVNAASAALDYVPFSGKGTAIAKQQKQFNTAIAKTIGENTDNVAQAVKSAETRLGAEFDKVLKNTAVKADTPFQNDLVRIMSDAQNEMTEQQLGVLSKQINNILNKVQTGDIIDADAAYNIKKGLDRVAKSNDSTLAYYARDTRNALMDALNRSLPDGGASFAKTRQQWGNLMELNKLLPRGAEGDISAARLGNARNIRSKDLGELADIGAQFIKGRVGDSGTAQRAGIYGLLGAGTMIDPVSAGIGLTVGRGLNSAMNSNMLTQRLINNSLAPLNSNAALAGQQVPGALVNRLAPYLIPAASTAGVAALNKP